MNQRAGCGDGGASDACAAVDANLLASAKTVCEVGDKGAEGGFVWWGFGIGNGEREELQADVHGHEPLVADAKEVRLPPFQQRNHYLDSGALHPDELIFEPIAATRAKDDSQRSRGISLDPEDIVHGRLDSYELLDAGADIGDAEAESGAFFNEREDLVELAAGMSAGEGDPDGMIEILAFDAGGFLDVVHPVIEIFWGDSVVVGTGAVGQLAEDGAGGVGRKDHGIFRVSAGGGGIEAEDGSGLGRELGERVRGGQKQGDQVLEPRLSAVYGFIGEHLQGNVRLQLGGIPLERSFFGFGGKPERKNVGPGFAKVVLGKTCNAVEVGLLQVMAIEPVELIEVEDGRAGRNALERKSAGELREGESLSFAVRSAQAEQRKVVDQRLGQIAKLTEGRDGGCAVTLGEALAVRAEDGGEVGELRDGPAKGLVDGYLLWGVGDVIVAADDVGDGHEGVVDGDHVVVDGNAGGDAAGAAHQDGVADGVGGELDRAADQIVEAEWMVFDSEANSVGLALGQVLGDSVVRKRAAAAGVDLRKIGGGGLGALGFEFLGGAEAAIGFAVSEQALGMLRVDGETLGLAIGPEGAFVWSAGCAWAFVPVEAEPAEVFDKLGFETGFGSFEISVFDAEDELASSTAGEEPVVEGGTRVAHVQQPGGRGGKADAGGGFGHDSNDSRW